MERTTVRIWGGRLFVAATFLLLVLVSAGQSYAQVDTGTILGTVTDSSGARISGATVTLTNEGTNAALSTTSGEDGGYKFTPVRIGAYKIAVTMQGFQTTTQHAVNVNVGQSVVADFSLKPGSVTETVEVTSTVPVLQSQDASVGQIVDSKNVNDLPLNGRNFTFLAQLAAGVNTPQADTRGNAATGAFAANGLRPAQNNYLLDGIDNNSDTVDFLNGTNFVVLPPVDAVQEFKVETSGFSAEHGRSGAAVLNATIKSGTNELHGSAWEFFRNDKLDAADFFENAGGIKKGALRQNQFGVSAGAPIIKNKIFVFGDYEGFRRVQGTVLTGSVPTALERSSGYTNLTDLLSQGGTEFDALNRAAPKGTVYDPATTRQVVAGGVDSVSGLPVPLVDHSGNPIKPGTIEFVRDPFGSCAPSTMNFTGCVGLNILPAGRLDANAISLLNLYPSPTSTSLFGNFVTSPKLFEHRNSFDTRMDLDFNDKNQLFFRFSYVDDPQFIPGIFGGVADGGGFAQGNQTANAQQSAFGYTHTFNPNLINVARAGFNYLHTTRNIPASNDLSGLPAKYGVLDIPQAKENGGLPAFGINGLQTLGGNAFLPSDEVSSTFQLTDDLTKIYGKHTFKAGFEWQHVKFSTLQPPWSRGQFNFDGKYTDVPGSTNGNVGIAQFLLIPCAAGDATCPTSAAGPTGIPYNGGPNSVFVSNISLTDNGKNYYGTYVQDDWKLTSKLTLNLGLRWDYFQPVYEHHGAQANFIPTGAPTGGPAYLLPDTKSLSDLSTDPTTGFTSLLAKDGIALIAGKNGRSLADGQKDNFAPRFGFAYQATPKLVVRGGFGIFYNGFENRGFSPNLGENYPFQFNFSFFNPDSGHPIKDFAGCATATPAGGPTLETGFSCTPLDPKTVKAGGLALRGIQFKYLTPYSMGGNLTLQYQLTPSMSVQGAYVTTLARHLEVFPGNNDVTSIEPTSVDASTLVPFKDFGRGNSQADTEGNSHYHGLQTRLDKQFKDGLTFLATYTYSKVMSDTNDLLNGGSVGANNGINGYRAPGVFGIHPDYRLAPFDIRNVFHFSGGYELPFGKGKKFMSDASGFTDRLVGGWSVQWIATLQDGQPIQISCITQTAQSLGCGALFVKGQPLKLGVQDITISGKKYVAWFGNPAAFTQPSPCTNIAGCDASVLEGITTVPGPGYHRLDFSFFKDIPFNEKRKLQFRTEMFNIFNHPNFNAPGFGGNGVVAISGSTDWTNSNFGRIGSTRDAPYDPRQIQFALKFIF